jgi:[CysO sulfur-carrier protein]-S-L-cysteine hydrolase
VRNRCGTLTSGGGGTDAGVIRPSRTSASTVHLPAALAERMLEQARAELPNEACGLVGGPVATGRATSFHAARNRHASSLRYDVHPEDLVHIMFAIESAGEQLLAVFHSHTGSPAIPSPTDVREARYDAVQLIASLADPLADAVSALRAWRVRDGSVSEVELRISA